MVTISWTSYFTNSLNTAPTGGLSVLILITSVGLKSLDDFSLTSGRCFFSASPSLPSLLGVIVGLAEIFLDGQFLLLGSQSLFP